ncbi:hypothetical protein MTR62_03840 [Novosphingobium sp. 1949]|uniref:Lipoprotein n=1 Tax=Novosphingobium organovorum TaxID=2930092 RepID=A0ABT0B9W7_9SPHN|nr:hypothetical protein [Novosphingobium organovorum]MCJ2181841.1 hypothetical protein [Novosphingobium organovorum]
MRRRDYALIVALGLVAGLGACQRKPDFDERYQAASKRIEDSARAIDAQISAAPPSGEPTDAPTPSSSAASAGAAARPVQGAR